MASMQIEVTASSSSPFSYVSLRDHKRSANIMGYVNSQTVRKNKANEQDEDLSWLPSQSSKTDDSWLPVIGHDSTVALESNLSGNLKDGNNADDSWLPAVDNSNGTCGTNMNDSENDIDYSWLPSSFVGNNKNNPNNDIINKNKTIKIKTKNTNTSINKNKNKSSNNNSNSNSSQHTKSRNDHWALARKVIFSCDDQQNQNVDSSPYQQQDSPLKSRYVVESRTLGGVSSLLQRWKDLSEVKNTNKEEKSPKNLNSSGSTCKENIHDHDTHSPPSSTTTEESNNASRSRRLSCPLPSRDSKDSNPCGAEKEKIRVVDIIKKLSREEELAASHSAGHGNQSLPPILTTLHHKQIDVEHKAIKNTPISRHLIRGRQAYNNFLLQMEHDKHHELKRLVDCKAVSKFSHRGRIKSMLRFKIMLLGVEPKPESKLRERFNSGSEKGATQSRKHRRNDLKNITNEESPATTSTTTTSQVEITNTKTTTSNKKQEPQPKPEPMTPFQSTQHSTTSVKDVVQKDKFLDSYSSPITHKEDKHYKDDIKHDFHEDEGQFMSARTSYGTIEDRERRMQALESFQDWMSSEYTPTRSDLDEAESYDTQLFDTDYDWISDISRPKSDWEDMRQTRYQEMLQHSLGNNDIQRLLERKSVSRFLGSPMRELIDQLMVNRIQQPHAQIEKQDLVVKKKEELRKEVEQEDRSMVDDDEDYRSRIETKSRSEYNEYADQTTYSEISWRPNDVVCDSETTTTTSPSIDRSPLSNRSHKNGTPKSSSSVRPHTIEMELIYNLRGHMEQLHNEIMDLRESIKSCVNMQVRLQHSFKQNVVAAATCSVQSKERKPPGIGKHNCCICYDMQVDSLLYRCGHMCTCFKCALELQRTCEQCPVCEAPIVDVVKAMYS